MNNNFANFKTASESVLEWLKKEYGSLRTSRATPSILDSISVESYGARMPVNQLATIGVEDPRTLRITPWDKELAKNIDKAIRESNLGLSVSVDAAGLRVSFPELTGERRKLLIKAAGEKLEEARIKVRTEREKVLGEMDRKEKAEEINKDEKFRLKNELQKLVGEINLKLEELSRKKEKEILE